MEESLLQIGHRRENAAAGGAGRDQCGADQAIKIVVIRRGGCELPQMSQTYADLLQDRRCPRLTLSPLKEVLP